MYYRASLKIPVVRGASVGHTFQFLAFAMLFLLFVGNHKVGMLGCDGL
jgi:hypothetical protein